jgi:mono/diheme cytochrome c family protein
VRAFWRILVAAVALVAVAALVFVGWIVFGPGPTDFAGRDRVAIVDFKGADPTGVPASLKDASLIDRGRYLIRAADCEACHTAIGGRPFAGGRAFVLPFGTMYSTNITPDRETGIGQYSDAEFLAAVRRGVRRDGARLYPAMPFASYTYLTDADALAIKAYLFSLEPISAPAIQNTFGFPFNQRWSMGVWAMMFDADRRFEPHADRSAQWNRGAYLIEALAHCGECHTPRNLFQALDNRRKFAGAVTGGWLAFNITSDPTSGVGDWTEQALAHYLATGHAEGRGTAAGPMGEAVDLSLVHLSGEDIAAMVAYLKTVPPIANPALPAPRPPNAIAAREPGEGGNPLGEQIYAEACASCHGWTGKSPISGLATIAGARSVNDPSGLNVAQVILFGGGRKPGEAGMAMPAFGDAYSDAEIAAAANYVTARFGAEGSRLTAENVARIRLMR